MYRTILSDTSEASPSLIRPIYGNYVMSWREVKGAPHRNAAVAAHAKLAAQSRKARAHKLRHPFVVWIGNHTQQVLDALRRAGAAIPNSSTCTVVQDARAEDQLVSAFERELQLTTALRRRVCAGGKMCDPYSGR
jgi:hypothetical protein